MGGGGGIAGGGGGIPTGCALADATRNATVTRITVSRFFME